jgi:hypothetical protein
MDTVDITIPQNRPGVKHEDTSLEWALQAAATRGLYIVPGDEDRHFFVPLTEATAIAFATVCNARREPSRQDDTTVSRCQGWLQIGTA